MDDVNIYEGDIINIHEIPEKIAIVEFSDGMFKANCERAFTPLIWHGDAVEVIGNIHQNSKLLTK